MKNILLILFTFFSTAALSQSTGYLRYDTVRVQKIGGNSTLIIENATRNLDGAFLQNYSQGRTRFAHALDSVWVDGDSIRFRYGSDTIAVLAGSAIDTTSLSNRIDQKLSIGDTASMLSPYLYGFNNIGSSPNAQGASAGSHLITLQPADSSFGGVVTTEHDQKIRGRKHFLNALQVSRFTGGTYNGVLLETGVSAGTRPDGLHIGVGGAGSFIRSRKGDLSDYLNLNIDAKAFVISASDSVAFRSAGASVPFTGSALDPDTIVGIAPNGTLDKIAIGSGLSLSGGVLTSTSGGGSQTLQDVFNQEIGGSVLTKTDTIDLNGNYLKLIGSGGNFQFGSNGNAGFAGINGGDNASFSMNPSLGFTLNSVIGSNNQYIDIGNGLVGINAQDGGGQSDFVIRPTGFDFEATTGTYKFTNIPDSTTATNYMMVWNSDDNSIGKAPLPSGGDANLLFDSLGTDGISPMTVRDDTLMARRISGEGAVKVDTTSSGGIRIYGGPTLYSRLLGDSALTNATTEQSLFPASQNTFTLEANSTYKISGYFYISHGTGSHTTSLSFDVGASGLTTYFVNYQTIVWNIAVGANTTAQATSGVTVLTPVNITGTTSGNSSQVLITGQISTNAGGTIEPIITFSADPGGSPVVRAGTYLEFTKIGSGNVQTIGAVN